MLLRGPPCVHRLGYLEIRNYRVCRDVNLHLGGFTPLVGPNNTGKSTILDAIAWILKPTTLKDSDFTDTGEPMIMRARIDGISDEVLAKVPEQKHRTAIEPYVKEGSLWIQATAEGTTKASIKQQVWDIEQYTGTDTPAEWRDYPTGLPAAISALLPEALRIGAMDDIAEDLGKSKAGTTMQQLLQEVMKPILDAHAELAEAVDQISSILTKAGKNRSGHLIEFDEKASEKVVEFFPDIAIDLDLQIATVSEFFKTGDLHVTDLITKDRRRFDQMGTGAQRAIQMALVRYLADSRAKATPETNHERRLLLIDEPELYLHPQGVRRLRQALRDLSEKGFQVVFTTHSPMMLDRTSASNVVRVSKHPKTGASLQLPLKAAVEQSLDDAPAQARTLFELGNMSEIYFSDLVVLCEGKTDRRLIPLAYERYFGRTPELDRTSFVSLGSCSDIPKALPVLAAMGVSAAAVADLDFGYVGARSGTHAILSSDSEDMTKAKARLKELANGSDFVVSESGLPTKNPQNGSSAAKFWSHFAKDETGKEIANETHQLLQEKGIWIWRSGCIEDVTDHQGKGEDAIASQEEQILAMEKGDFEKTMQEMASCLDWIRQEQPVIDGDDA